MQAAGTVALHSLMFSTLPLKKKIQYIRGPMDNGAWDQFQSSLPLHIGIGSGRSKYQHMHSWDGAYLYWKKQRLGMNCCHLWGNGFPKHSLKECAMETHNFSKICSTA